MAAIATTAIELPRLGLDPHAGIAINHELNNDCQLTDACGADCILDTLAVEGTALTQEQHLDIAKTIIANKRRARQYTFAGKEPSLSRAVMISALACFHSLEPEDRCQAVGMITNGLAIKRDIGFLAETPLSWALMSLDGLAHTHRRGMSLFQPTLAAANLLRAQTKTAVGINTTVTPDNIDSVIALGRMLQRDGFEYWSCGSMMHRVDGSRMMQPVLDVQQTIDFVARLLSTFNTARAMPVVIEMPPPVWRAVQRTGWFAQQVAGETRWRWELRRPDSQVVVVCDNPRPGTFFRIRWQGDVVDKAGFLTPRAAGAEPTYGHASPGRIAALLSEGERLTKVAK